MNAILVRDTIRRDNSKNRRYTKEEKESLIARMLPPENISPSKLSFETGISKSTLATWRTKATIFSSRNTAKSKKNMSSTEKFLIVM
ncbi:transposase [Clostridium sp. Sa3CVN1]|uniref:Transposase n=1 Tax=Clostridium cibarium TaxID=2762247 RepID=A0ABR8PY55_9CLOT|nr:transposase [Clostridium cibarium]